jgi:phosphopantetheinyl transferase (holo-ACP synthase)
LLSERQFRGACLKDDFGKPYLKDSIFHISMSHSGSYTAVLASPKIVGIDIQVKLDKIERIAPKFVSDAESKHLDKVHYIESLHCIWGAKESMYKAYGRRELDFKKHIFVEQFVFNPIGFVFSGRVVKDDFNEKYTLFCQQIEHLILVYAIQQ